MAVTDKAFHYFNNTIKMKPFLPSAARRSLQVLSSTLNAPYVCARCLSGTTSRQSTMPPYPPSKSYAQLPTRRLISVIGPDASHFLQGVITQNVTPKIPRSAPGFYAAFLNSQGRVINDVFIYDYAAGGKEGFLIEVDAKEADKLYKHVRRYKLRSKFEVRLIDEGEMGVWSRWDEDGGAWTKHSISQPSATKPNTPASGITLPDTRAPGMGYRLILPAGKKPEVDTDESSELEYRIRRYMKGVAEGQDEILRETALPQESNIDYMGGIDYRKGCYVGQELTIRTHHTGVVRKRILPVMVYGEGETIPKDLAYVKDSEMDAAEIPAEKNIGKVEKRGRSPGKWLAGTGNVGLALCRLEMMTEVSLGGEGGGGNYTDGDEFKVDWDDGQRSVKLKAFVPSWHLNR